MNENTKYRLQLLNHGTTLKDREEAYNYLKYRFKDAALIGEPAIVYYGDTTDPKAIIALGTPLDNHIFTIDTQQLEEELAKVKTIAIENKEAITNIDAIKSDISDIIEAAGLFYDDNKKSNKISFDTKNDDIVGDEDTLGGAILRLSKYLQKYVSDNIFTTESTKSVDLVLDNDTKQLRAEVKISTDGSEDDDTFNDNIINLKENGLFASVDLEYDDVRNCLIFTTSGINANGKFTAKAKHKTIELGKHTEIVAERGQNSPIKINVNKTDDKTVIKGNVILSDDESNILEVQDGALLVKGKANNIAYKDTTVFKSLNDLNKKTEELYRKKDITVNNSNSIDFTYGKDYDDCPTLTGKVKLADDDSIKITGNGLSVDLNIDVDENTKEIVVRLGKNEKRVKLPDLPEIDLSGIVKSISYDKSKHTLTIYFNNDQYAIIDVADILTPYTFKSNEDSPVKLEEYANQNGTSRIGADIKLSTSKDNLLKKKNGELYVSGDDITKQTDVTVANLEHDIDDKLQGLRGEAEKEFISINSTLNECAKKDELRDTQNTIEKYKDDAINNFNVINDTLDNCVKSTDFELYKQEAVHTIDNLKQEATAEFGKLNEGLTTRLDVNEFNFFKTEVEHNFVVLKHLAEDEFDKKANKDDVYTRPEIEEPFNELRNKVATIERDINSLDNSVSNIKFTTADTDTIQMINDDQELRAIIKISGQEGNIIKPKKDGIYAKVNEPTLSYDSATNTLTFNGERFALAGITAFSDAYYNPDKKQIILKVKINGKEDDTIVRINVSDIVKPLVVADTQNSPVVLRVDKDADGSDRLSATLNLQNEEDNLLGTTQSGALYASINKILTKFEEKLTPIKQSIGQIKDDIEKLKIYIDYDKEISEETNSRLSELEDTTSKLVDFGEYKLKE